MFVRRPGEGLTGVSSEQAILRMSPDILEHAARDVLACYACLRRGLTIQSLGNHGGFSGARLWRVADDGEPLCLRAWPSREADARRLQSIHHLQSLARDRGLVCIPKVYATADGS